MTADLTTYPWQLRYCTSALNRAGKPTDILHDFYLPALSRITRYDRVAGYFRSSSLAAASQGYTAFLNHGGTMRLIVGADLQIQDVAAILAGNQKRLSDQLSRELEAPETWPEAVQNGVALLGAMVSSGQLEIRVAFRVNPVTNAPLSVDSVEDGYVHEKWFVMEDPQGRRLYGSGSLNESRTALIKNAENIDVHCDWQGETDRARVEEAQENFLALWENRNPHMRVMEIPEAVQNRLVRLKNLKNQPLEIDGTAPYTAAEPSLEEALKFSVLRDAPKMPGGVYLGMYTAPVEPWPHQEIVSRRLIESWPYSWLLCDEVGLGKTIETALAIRSLILSGRADRVLIVAPASLTEQWQRELAQKALLPFALSRTKPGGKILHRKIYPQPEEAIDADLYSPQWNIVSSGLVSRRDRALQLANADPYDIVLIDEAHYARRKNPQKGAKEAPQYGLLYEALQNGLRRKTQSLWMATATPMQIDPVEVYDLFRLANRSAAFQSDPELSAIYFRLLGEIASRRQLTRQQWALLGQSFLQIEASDPFLWKLLQNTVVTGQNRKILPDLPVKPPKKADIRALVRPLFAASPLSRVMMRHTRSLLEIYRQNGELKSNLARRHVRPLCTVRFTEEEAAFYDALKRYCGELNRQVRKYNPQTRQMMTFLLNFLQLRFASSLYAIQMTLSRRLQKVKNTLLAGARTFESQEELDESLQLFSEIGDDQGADILLGCGEEDLNDIPLDAVLKDRSREDLEWEQKRLKQMLAKLEKMRDTPSKIQALLEELDRRKVSRSRLRQTVLFTRFYDTLLSIRNCLRVRNADLRVGVYAGSHASWYDPDAQKDTPAAHETIKRLFLTGKIDLLLCTDAAAEGLNLQTADLLINFDLGWNPMKVEQRIGRIDRIGQTHNDIEVLNMCYLGSAEEIVYGRLLDRLQQANLIVGTQQISMLPVTPGQFRDLANGELTEEQLEKESVRQLKKQREAAACMEMNAEDLYHMYQRMNQAAQAQTLPADLTDLWQTLTSSPYLKSRGGKILDDGLWHLPYMDGLPEIVGTIQRESTQENTQFLTWGNTTVEQIFDFMAGNRIENAECVKRISVQEDSVELIGYAIATTEGTRLVTSFRQLEGIRLNTDMAIESEHLEQCKKKLSELLKVETDRIATAKRAECVNTDIALLHDQLIHYAAVSLLKEKEQSGLLRFSEALKELETNTTATYLVTLPEEIFAEKETQLLFLINGHGGKTTLPVSDSLLTCILSLISRVAAAIRTKSSEKRTSDIIRKLEQESYSLE